MKKLLILLLGLLLFLFCHGPVLGLDGEPAEEEPGVFLVEDTGLGMDEEVEEYGPAPLPEEEAGAEEPGVEDPAADTVDEDLADAAPGEEATEEAPVEPETPEAEKEADAEKWSGPVPAPSLTGNPAEAAFAGTRFELVFPEISMDAGNNLFNLDYLDTDFTGDAGEAKKAQFLNQIKGTGFQGQFNGGLRTGITVGRFSIQLHPWVSGSLNLGEALPRLFFDGLKPDSEYSLSGLGVSGLAAAALDLSYAHPIKLTEDTSLGVGVTLRYLQGLGVAYAKIDNGKIETNEYGETSYTISEAMFYQGSVGGSLFEDDESNGTDCSGQGAFFDLGAVYRQKQWQAGVALRNIGSMTWQGLEGERLTEELKGDIITGGPNGPEFGFEEDEELEYESETFDSYTHSLPIVLEVHGSYQLLRTLAVSAGVDKAMENGWGYSTNPRFWTGLDWRPIRPLRLSGTIARQGAAWYYNALFELRLWAWWLNLQLGQSGTGFTLDKANGFTISLSSCLHF